MIPNAVDTDEYSPFPLPKQTEQTFKSEPNKGIPHDNVDTVKVLVLSRLVYRKGIDLLTHIIPKACSLDPRLIFVIGGSGPKSLNLQEMIETNSLESRVTLIGDVSRSDVPSFLRSGDVFLNCSLTESFCIALLEGAICGNICVSNDVGGVSEVLPEGMCVYGGDISGVDIVDSMVDALMNGVSKFDAIKADIRGYKINAYNKLKGLYTWDVVAGRTEEVYYEMIEERNVEECGDDHEFESLKLKQIREWLNVDTFGGYIGGFVAVAFGVGVWALFGVMDLIMVEVEVCRRKNGEDEKKTSRRGATRRKKERL